MEKLLFVVLAFSGAFSWAKSPENIQERKTMETPFHVNEKDIPQAEKKLWSDISEDFQTVLSGKKPRNAKKEKEPYLADGGTVTYIGSGYEITVRKSLARFFGVDGYLYGPIVKVNSAVGTDMVISQIEFYDVEKIRELLGKK